MEKELVWSQIERAPIAVFGRRQANTKVFLGGFKQFTTIIAGNSEIIFE
jgi:hypothetical protein